MGSHRRFNPLRNQWVLVSPHRTERPWQGQVEAPARPAPPAYDPTCYLCPGNVRANGETNPQYSSTFAFDNDFAALLPVSTPPSESRDPLLIAAPERGICRVLCFSPRHDLAIPLMAVEDIHVVVDAWIRECERIAALEWPRYALVFENRGAMMGASNPHPHCQIWATEHVPDEPLIERQSMAAYKTEHGSCLLCDYAALELDRTERVVCENASFVALVPFWAVWPFETLVISRRHVASLSDLSSTDRNGLADIMKRLTMGYDRLFGVAFPYSMGFHQSIDRLQAGEQATLDHLHAHFYPPLLRSATIRKFMVGFELLGSPQRDLTTEHAADRLRQAVQQSE